MQTKVGGATLAERLGAGVGDLHEVAAMGVSGAGGSLPHGDTIQRAFGRHDVSSVQAHTGGDAETASRALGAEAYATGTQVAFAGAPSLHTAAHEAAHVVQQRGGVQLKGGIGSAGDAHEQHADAVADAVVRGGSAEALLDQYAGGATAGAATGAAIQRQEVPRTGGDDPAITQLDAVQPVAFAGIQNGTFDIAGVVGWMDQLAQALEGARTAAAGVPTQALTEAVTRCLTRNASALNTAAAAIRTATVQLTNDSSVANATPAPAVFPTQAQARRLNTDAGRLNQVARAGLPITPGTTGTSDLQAASATAQDAGLALLQSLSVVAARTRWQTGTSTETPSASAAGHGTRTELDNIFGDSGFSGRVSTYTGNDGNQHVFDWCGMFVVSSYFRGAAMSPQLRGGFWHTDNVQDFFNYRQQHNAQRVPMAIWAENQWWNLQAYHQARGSLRTWTPRATIQAALASGGTVDIRPGDTCLIDHHGGNTPSHIVMVESYNPTTRQLVTIEGNTFGIHADSTGRAERVDADHLRQSTQGSGTAAGVHVRDMNQLAPSPGDYVVTSSSAYVREDENLARFKQDAQHHRITIPVNTQVHVSEIREVGGTRYANVDGYGWTSFSNLGTSSAPPAGGYSAASGATVWGVGRPSAVDFEDGHDYATSQVPAALQHTSPADIRALAQRRGSEGAAARGVDLR